MTKEKTYKKRKDAVKALKDKECCVYDKHKKKYVNTKIYSKYKNPFNYNIIDGVILVILGSVIGSMGGAFGVIIGGVSFGLIHWWYTYRRLL